MEGRRAATEAPFLLAGGEEGEQELARAQGKIVEHTGRERLLAEFGRQFGREVEAHWLSILQRLRVGLRCPKEPEGVVGKLRELLADIGLAVRVVHSGRRGTSPPPTARSGRDARTTRCALQPEAGETPALRGALYSPKRARRLHYAVCLEAAHDRILEVRLCCEL